VNNVLLWKKNKWQPGEGRRPRRQEKEKGEKRIDNERENKKRRNKSIC